jgi:hypothetical protein
MTFVSRTVIAAAAGAVLLLGTTAGAQEPASTSADVAKALTAALDAAKVDSVAAAIPGEEGTFAGTLYFPGLQLLVVEGKYSVPVLLNARIEKKEYRDTYLDLNGAAEPSSKIFIEDLGANGLVFRPQHDDPADVYEVAGKRIVFNHDWKAQGMSEDDYTKAFTDADARYTVMLKALLAQAQKP